MELHLTTDPAAFLARAGAHLAADPVLGTVVATVAERAVRDGNATPDDWYLTVCDGPDDTTGEGRVLGVAMRTAPFAPRPAYVLAMPDAAARLAARACHERGEGLTQVNGALAAARAWLEETAELVGGPGGGPTAPTVQVRQHTRLFEAREVVDPRPVPGRLRTARLDEAELVAAWYLAFHGDADEQAGRVRETDYSSHVRLDDVRHRIETGRVLLWEVDGRAVHVTGVNAPALGAARIGPVYTPPAERGRGFASVAVAEVSRRIIAVGARPCLFTDQANPTSNAIYQALGYRPVVDMAEIELV